MPLDSGCKGASKCGTLVVKFSFFCVVVLLVGIGKAALDSLLRTVVVHDKLLSRLG